MHIKCTTLDYSFIVCAFTCDFNYHTGGHCQVPRTPERYSINFGIKSLVIEAGLTSGLKER